MRRRKTLSELRYITTPPAHLADQWSKDFSVRLLDKVWKGYDLLRKEILTEIDVSEAEDDLERNITELLEKRIRDVMDGDEPFYIQHNSSERETRKIAPAQPPEYDLAFVFHANERLKWPLEAKILKGTKKGDMTSYISDVKNEFLTCRYAPFSSEGAMLGYLLSGKAANIFSLIEADIPCVLTVHPDFPRRHHKISDHQRIIPAGKENEYPSEFRCHHLVLPIK